MNKSGIQVKNTCWSDEKLELYLGNTCTPIRLACINSSGFPAIVPLWYVWDGSAFWCATHRDAKLLDFLRQSPNVGFEIANNEPPYVGVRGQGEVELVPQRGAGLILDLLQKYLPGVDNSFTRWLLSRQEEEVALKIYPHSMSVWDFSKRMQLEEVQA